ncbi:MAG: hypothetical protein GTN40_03555 [Candidatus Aenigmarchaeota archaeon]|nr:hypothetical protein [Candidatus Aenigmarchaeota archaeon]
MGKFLDEDRYEDLDVWEFYQELTNEGLPHDDVVNIISEKRGIPKETVELLVSKDDTYN